MDWKFLLTWYTSMRNPFDLSGLSRLGMISVSTVQPLKRKVPEQRFFNLKLYNYWRSSCSWRVRLALAAKGIPYQYVAVNLLQKKQQDPEFGTKNSMLQVPTLEFEDSTTGRTSTLSQSMAIIEFLEEAFPSRKQLFPDDPGLRATVRQMAEVVNSGIQPLQNLGNCPPFSPQKHFCVSVAIEV